MFAVIVANGILEADERLRELWARCDLRVAADGGARNAREQLGLPPQVVIGDLDSLDDLTRDWLMENSIEFIQHPVAKDETDLELALLLAQKRGADKTIVLGALGGRPDQMIANILLLARWPGVVLAGASEELWVANGRAEIEGVPGDTVSLIPLDKSVEGIITRDLLYPLRGETLMRGSTRGVSNELTARRAVVEWERGAMLIVHLRTHS